MVKSWPPAAQSGQALPDAGSSSAVANLVYRSKAATPFSALDLHRLTLAAQARNRTESVTGLLLYDSERFFQWLEGPPDGIARIMQSILLDARHEDVEILREQPIQERRFGEWNMKLAVPGTGPFSWPPEAIKAPSDMVQRLRERPDEAPGLLIRLVPAPVAVTVGAAPAMHEFSRVAVDLRASSIIDDVIRETVIPTLASRRARQDTLWHRSRVNSHVRELADLLIAPEATAGLDLIARLRAEEGLLSLYPSLVEPVARCLGDLWSDDFCTEFDVTLALCRLQMAVRYYSPGSADANSHRSGTPCVLIAPEPGELHHLGAALDSEVLWQAGWTPHSAFPDSDEALQELVASTWFDALDLSLSPAFRREHWLPRLTQTIVRARHASRNPSIVVVVGGRVFTDRGTEARTGADATSRTSAHIDRSILDALRTSRLRHQVPTRPRA